MRCESRSVRISPSLSLTLSLSLSLSSSARYLSLPSRYTTRRILIRRRVAIKRSTRVYRRYRFRPNIPPPPLPTSLAARPRASSALIAHSYERRRAPRVTLVTSRWRLLSRLIAGPSRARRGARRGRSRVRLLRSERTNPPVGRSAALISPTDRSL